MASLHIETITMGGFTYRNWIVSNDDGEIVIADQDAKILARLLALTPAEFIEDYMDGCASAPDTPTMEHNILQGLTKRLDEMGLPISNLTLWEE